MILLLLYTTLNFAYLESVLYGLLLELSVESTSFFKITSMTELD